MSAETCKGNHRYGSAVKAVGRYRDQPLCRRHLNRCLQDDRLNQYRCNGTRCPDHPERLPRVSSWYGEPRLACTKPTGEKVHYKPSGRGVVRQPGGTTYTEWCRWTAEIPKEVIHP